MSDSHQEEKGLLHESSANPTYGSESEDCDALKQYRIRLRPESHVDSEAPDDEHGSVLMNGLDYLLYLLNEQLPSICVVGMQRMEKRIIDATADHAADFLDAQEHPNTPLSTLNGEAKLQRLWEQKSLLRTVLERSEKRISKSMTSPTMRSATMCGFIWFFLVGYNYGILNIHTAETVVYPGLGHSTAAWARAVAAFPTGGLVGAFLGYPFANRYGRCKALAALTYVFLVGGVLSALALNAATIQLARFTVGLASGMTTTVVPVYLGEIVPPPVRSKVGNRLQQSTALGLFGSFLVPFVVPRSVMFGLTLVPLCIISHLVESPRWMLQRQSFSMQARRNLAELRGAQYIHEIDSEAMSMTLNAATMEPFDARSIDRNVVAIGCVLQVVQQLSGINAIFYYSNSMMDDICREPRVATLVLGLVYLLSTLAVDVMTSHKSLLESVSRRKQLLVSHATMIIIAVWLSARPTELLSQARLTVALLAGYVGLVPLGLGILPNLLVVESIADVSHVTKMFMLGQQVNWGAQAIVAAVFPFLWKSVGIGTFGVFAVVLLLSFLGTACLVPNSVGKTKRQYYNDLTLRRPVASLHGP